MSDRAESVPRPVFDGISIAIAVGLVAITFGVLARTSGLSVAKTCAMSLLVFTGASEFAAVSVLQQGGSVAALLGTSLLLAARNSLYGPVVSRWFGHLGRPRRAVLAQLIIDESSGVGAAQQDPPPPAEPRNARLGFLAGGIGVYVLWNLGTLVGALAGDVVGDVGRWGLDAAFPASFVALLAPHLSHRPGRFAAVIAAVLTIVSVPVLPIGVPVLIGALAVLPAAWLTRPDEDEPVLT